MYGLLYDANLCIGCGACMEACKEKNHLPESTGSVLSATDYTVVKDMGDDSYLRQMCMHCLEPSCVSACPVGALTKTPEGPVVYDSSKCIGCRYCMVACPFSVPRYEWASTTPTMRKCNLCADRVCKGLPTACAEACPTEATTFGERSELLRVAWTRIAGDPEHYAQRVYGSEEAGGTSVLIIGPPEIMNTFNPRIPKEALPGKTWVVLSEIPTSVGVAGAGMLAVNWVIRRRMALAKQKITGSSAAEPSILSPRDDDGGEEQ